MDLIRYILESAKSKRLSKQEVLHLLPQLKYNTLINSSAIIHPLLHTYADESKLFYRSIFKYDDDFIKGHIIGNKPTMPGVVYLEMAQAAALQHADKTKSLEADVCDIVWINPLIIEKTAEIIDILIVPEGDTNYLFEISKDSGDKETEPIIFCQGRIEMKPREEIVSSLDIESIRSLCESIYSSSQCYDFFKSIGIEYATSNQGIKELYAGDNQVIAKLQMPRSYQNTAHKYDLHPIMIDAALQAGVGFLMNNVKTPVSLPFALDRIQLIRRCTAEMWAYIVYSNNTSENSIQKLDITLCDESGNVCVMLTGYMSRKIETRGFKIENNREQNHSISEKKEIHINQPEDVEVNFEERAINFIRNRLAQIIKLAAQEIDIDAPLEKYGIDSIRIMQMTTELEKSFGPLSKTLFYEYHTTKQLAAYFIENYRNQLTELLRVTKETSSKKSFLTKPTPTDFTVQKSLRHRATFKKIETKTSASNESKDIAIIGLAGRYPKARNIHEFWQNLAQGLDCISEIPKDRWDHTLHFSEDKANSGKSYSKWGGFIDDVDKFDPLFFSISPRDAEKIDPQERLFLQCVHETLEDAGYTRQSLQEKDGNGVALRIGVFVGVMYQEYQLYGAQEQAAGNAIALAGNSASIANRVSYFYNFQGPSLAVDTMCSSSLTSIHLACQSIINNECSLAIAGGVNVSVHPNKYLILSQGKFVSSKGKCESFGEGGDGYVPGEGVGAVLLKPLTKAIEDNDRIYGVIKATSLNHGGKTNGYTVPNPHAQADVIRESLEQLKINPRAISYLEAHGTGTSLGDPIELAGLQKSFGAHAHEKQFCAIGSVKSNIGHCESAAGIAGVTKVLLQLKYKKLVPSLHSKTLNPNINFQDSAFYVQQELADWNRPIITNEGSTIEYPRIAGISSFGAGGSNAHIIIEEYDPQLHGIKKNTEAIDGPFIITLSAKNQDRLKEYGKNVLAFLEAQKFSDLDLPAIAYTLQTGRESLDERLAIVTDSLRELKDTLHAYLDGTNILEGFITGQAQKNKELVNTLHTDGDAGELIETWIKKGKLRKVAELWANGWTFNWDILYPMGKPQRLSLPTYPFAKERYWAPDKGISKRGGEMLQQSFQIHPLLHINTSDFSEQRYITKLSGTEFYLRDHVINGVKTLPGVAYLEMARAAAQEAMGLKANDFAPISIKNLTWVRPFSINGKPENIHISLLPEISDIISFEIYSERGTNQNDSLLLCKGSIHEVTEAKTVRHDIKLIQDKLNQQCYHGNDCYQFFDSIGISYGITQRSIDRLYTDGNSVLAKLSLPSSIADTLPNYVLHPSLTDAALQASIGLIMNSKVSGLSVPYRLDAVEIVQPCQKEMWAYIQRNSNEHNSIQKLDIDICDNEGQVCVRIIGFTTKEIKLNLVNPAAGRTLTLKPSWKEKPITQAAKNFSKHILILCEPTKESCEHITNSIPSAECIHLESTTQEVDKKYIEYATYVFSKARQWLKEKSKGKTIIQLLVPTNEKQRLFGGLVALLKTIQQENPSFQVQLLSIDSWNDPTFLVSRITENLAHSEDKEVSYDHGKRLVKVWTEVFDAATATIPWKDSAVYVITGGAGGVGLLFAKEIADKVKNPSIILLGRSALSAHKKSQLDEIEKSGAFITYEALDLSSSHETEAFFKSLDKPVHAIIHSAGIVKDNYIVKKSAEEFQEVLVPKVSGLVNLDNATKDIPVEYFILFSSVAGALGNAGQADYACANGFMDAYAAYRNDLTSRNTRHGKTLSVNWPLWQDGGMRLDEAAEKLMTETLGLVPMQTATAIGLLYKSLASHTGQVMLFEGNIPVIKQKLLRLEEKETTPLLKQPELNKSKNIQENDSARVQNELLRMVSELLNVKLENIDKDSELSEYGFESVTLTEFANLINKRFNLEVTPVIFYEHATLQSLTNYLIQEHPLSFISKTESKTLQESPPITTNQVPEDAAVRRRISSHVRTWRVAEPKTEPSAITEPIAIIGISGRFPMADDLPTFWQNLIEGKDCISEIPVERWDWKKYFGDPYQEKNKTNIKWGGFIKGVDEFDPIFFGISPKEAEMMDPQQRLAMMYTWKVIEDAGYAAENLSGSKTGIFIGTAASDYSKLITKAGIPIEGYSATGVVSSIGPNRMSYFLNFHGPSEPIETACSSSLVAIHHAIEAIYNGSADMAIAGGVNTIISPDAHISFNKAGMLAEDGRCKTFSDKANGYVRGEGVGMIFLKRLSQAEKDNDNIYAVIKGTAINHGGHANSMTAPNPKAQAELLVNAYSKAGVDPDTITYVEAHGTGTELGDPIEINGLQSAFKSLFEKSGKKQEATSYCGLGSVKTNIGHLELAAGIAGIMKVILQLKYKTLVKSLHADTTNPYIKLNGSPFYIVQENTEWKSKTDKAGNAIPRRAGVSSFGFGGVNAHVVIEEYTQKENRHSVINTSLPFILSAKSEVQLNEKAKELLVAIEQQNYDDNVLINIAYTLQVGRNPMEYRLGWMADSISDLKDKIKNYLNGITFNDFYIGRVDKKSSSPINNIEEVSQWVADRKYEKILQEWITGKTINWNLLYPKANIRRISLPSYPFAKKRFWIPETPPAAIDIQNTKNSILHPLLHKNTSTLQEQRFTSLFNGNEFFFTDHVMKGEKILPGMACVEMMMEATQKSTHFNNETECIEFSNINWISPVAAQEGATEIYTGIYPESHNNVNFKIYSVSQNKQKDHCRGNAKIITKTIGESKLPIDSLLEKITQRIITREECYAAFSIRGMQYGKAFQAIQSIQAGENELIANLKLPDEINATFAQYYLHPVMLDAALQAAIGFDLNNDSSNPSLPFTLEKVNVFGACEQEMWAYLRIKEGNAAEGIKKIDIHIVKPDGTQCLQIKGLSFLPLNRPVGLMSPSVKEETTNDLPVAENLALVPMWNALLPGSIPFIQSSYSDILVVGENKRMREDITSSASGIQTLKILDSDSVEAIYEKLSHHENFDHLIWITPESNNEQTGAELIASHDKNMLLLFRVIKALMRIEFKKDFSLTIITSLAAFIKSDDKIDPAHSGIHGFMGSVAKEFSHWRIKLVDVEATKPCPVNELLSLPPDTAGNPWAHRDGEWYRQELLPATMLGSEQDLYKNLGVYVVIGGAGGIGEVWTKYMLTNYNATVIWIGRSPENEIIRKKINRLSLVDNKLSYLQADAGDLNSLTKAYNIIKKQHAKINGIIHAAITLIDQSLINMTEAQLAACLASKVNTSVCMAEVFKSESPDFVLFFSSMMSFTKAPGQANYAAGCTFIDAFARQLITKWKCPVKVMNWGYWGSVGIVRDKMYLEKMAQLGIASIEPPEAMEILKQLLGNPLFQLGYIKTTKALKLDGYNSSEKIEIKQAETSRENIDITIQVHPTHHTEINDVKAAMADHISEMDDLMGKILFAQLHESGKLISSTDSGISPLHTRWYTESLAILEHRGFIKTSGKSRQITDLNTTSLQDLWITWEAKKQHWLTNPGIAAQVKLVESTLHALPELLRGERIATEIIFPNSTMTMVEGIYRNNPVADFFNRILVEALASYIENRIKCDPSCRIKILEVGAGTGGSTARILDKLKIYKNHIEEYCFTDVSKAFLISAEKKFVPDHPYVTCKIFDVQLPIAIQAIDGSYDIALATNVFHATNNIRETIRNTKATLKKDGFIFINEISHNSLFSHLTFGLLEGWWRFEDHALRMQGGPALAAEKWHEVLAQEGFEQISFVDQRSHELGQQVIFARSNGIARQVIKTVSAKQTASAIAADQNDSHTYEKRSLPNDFRNSLKEKAVIYFCDLIAHTLKLQVHEIDAAEPFEKYGLDSILIIELSNTLRQHFGNISSSLFFEHRNIDSLVDHFIHTKPEALAKLIGINPDLFFESTSHNGNSNTNQFANTTPRFISQEQRPNTSPPSSHNQEIAIIGLAGRFPEAETMEQFWQNLSQGKSCITEIPKDRWDWRNYFDKEKGKHGNMYNVWGGFIKDIDKFDPLFFQITPKEAEEMDPQERLFLQNVYATLEDAGYTPEALSKSRKVGVFAGVMNSNYPTGANYWSIANRISYTLNFQGPSMTVDTACSSSLTAIHLALESLSNGTCECAIAGGVNLIVDPVHYLKLSAMTMLSSDDRCKAFGAQADGFVDGEGLGSVLLKPLDKAIADGDHIYGVILGSMVNAGGKTSGYTVSNPVAQAVLISNALKRSKVDSRMVSYVEAHGTGTFLGDPIEISGLTKAFESVSGKPYCSIGSVKTNIGHLESAAGIAGIAKVLLQLKHQKLVPSLHARELNPNIDFENSPFSVQQKLDDWKRPVLEINGESKEYPRIAGISSFGAGGANAHVILREYAENNTFATIRVDQNNPGIFPLSAQSTEQLSIKAQQLLQFITDHPLKEDALGNIAYTLQVGRQPMKERLAILATSVDDLMNKLQQFINGQKSISGLYRGEVRPAKDAIAILSGDEDTQQLIRIWIDKKKISKLAEIWVTGLSVNWEQLYHENKPSRISLPTYPFAKERYWKEKNRPNEVSLTASHVHPLIQQNISNFSTQHFCSTFTGKESFLAHHKVNGEKVLPATAYLEMAMEAVQQSLDSSYSPALVTLNNIKWVTPFIASYEDRTLHIILEPVHENEIVFEIFARNEGTLSDKDIHCRGYVELSDNNAPAAFNIEEIKDRCAVGHYSADECYTAFASRGIEYGISHRGIEKIYKGEKELLAKISIPELQSDADKKYTLHPGLTDAALQSCIAFSLGVEHSDSLSIPVALDKLDIYSKYTHSMWAYVYYQHDATNETEQKLDVVICHESGEVSAKLSGLSIKTIDRKMLLTKEKITSAFIAEPDWIEKYPSAVISENKFQEHWVILHPAQADVKNTLENQIKEVKCYILQNIQVSPEETFRSIAVEIFGLLQQILKNKPQNKILFQCVLSVQGEQQLLAGISGMLKTALSENPQLVTQLIILDTQYEIATLASLIKQNSTLSEDSLVRHINDKRYVSEWKSINATDSTVSCWKDNGVYIITGGLGGLGFLFTREIASKCSKPIIIITGRSTLVQVPAKFEKLNLTGATIEYIQTDITNKDEVSHLIEHVLEKYGSLNGVIHSAGVTKDNYIIKKTVEEFVEVLSPKVTGTIRLDEATQNVKLDFFTMFSSVAGVTGNPGQSDYSTANAFLDAYAVYRDQLVSTGQRYGQTCSINWPLWKDGGMKIKNTEAAPITHAGMNTASGIEAFYQCIASGKPRWMVLESDPSKKEILPQLDFEIMKEAAYGHGSVSIQHDELNLEELTVSYLKSLLSQVTKLPLQRIDATAPLDTYGIDSIMVTQLNNLLEKSFGSLPKTLFYEYGSLKELSGYFIRVYRDQLLALLTKGNGNGKAEVNNNVVAQAKVSSPVLVPSIFKQRNLFESKKEIPGKDEVKPVDIAIIGLAGKYPEAENIQSYWNNLVNGKDCITEIPKERWDSKLFYDTDKTKPGKTNTKWGGFLKDVDKFDPLLFNLSPRDAEIMDPQERLFMQCCYEALEDSGYTKESILKSNKAENEGDGVGVFVGVMYEEYQLYGAQEQILGKPVALSGNPSSVANRVSYYFNLNGPSIAVDTMCSSSLTALHLACQSIINGDCHMAFAGGVNVSIHPNKYLLLGQGKFASSKGRCESFGQGGDGYVPGEGVGVVILKPLAQAVADGDNIYGIVKSTAINHGGRTNGYTVPNPNAQAKVIANAIKRSGISPRAISYIEAHGTGTSLGDPIEIAGLSKAFEAQTHDKQFCAIGSVKSTIGHCESAAGIAGVTKVLLQMKYKKLVPSLHTEILNPNIDFSNSPFTVQRELTDWNQPVFTNEGKSTTYPRIAGISSFGAGGSNAHVILEEYQTKNSHSTDLQTNARPVAILVSAKNNERLKILAQRLLSAIDEWPLTDNDLLRIAFTLQTGRESMSERLALLVNSTSDLIDKLRKFLNNEADQSIYSGNVEKDQEASDLQREDNNLQKNITKWISNHDYTNLINLWIKGIAIDWNLVYHTKPQRISLPNYPFNNKRYWYPEIDFSAQYSKKNTPSGISQNTASTTNHSFKFLKKYWKESQITAADKSSQVSITILTTSETAELATIIGKSFNDHTIITIPPGDPEGLKTSDQWLHADCLVDLTGCTTETDSPWIYSLPWIQQFIENNGKKTRKLVGVSMGLESWKNGNINLSGALHAGLYRMLQSEYSHIRSLHVDLDPLCVLKENASHIIQEIYIEPEDIAICYRESTRFKAYLNEVVTENNVANFHTLFPSEKVLLITGGTRGLGYTCAKHFVKKYGIKKIALLHKEVLPDEKEWNLRESKNDSITIKIKNIRELRALGAIVQVFNGTLSEFSAMTAIISKIKNDLGNIGGVIHCAGSFDLKNPAFIRKSANGIRSILEPKVTGLKTLYNVVKDETLEFFLLFSSTSTLIPSLAAGQSDYAMANGFMDYFAEAKRGETPITSILWPSWKESGIGESKTRSYKSSGLLSLADEEALKFLDEILLKNESPVIMPVKADDAIWQADILMKRSKSKITSAKILKTLENKTPISIVADDLQVIVERWLTEIFSRELKIPVSELESEMEFQEFGVDSILLAQVISLINQKIEEEIDPSILFEYPSIKKISRWLASQYNDKLAQSFGKVDVSSVSEIVNLKDAESKTSAPVSKEVNSNLATAQKPQDATGIAVIGMSSRFPGGESLDDYWRLLSEGRSHIAYVPAQRWGSANRYHAGLLENTTWFDPKFFNIPVEDAVAMDPQALMLLEEVLKTICHGGYTLKEMKGKSAGVYMGGRSLNRLDEQLLLRSRNPIVAIGQNYLAANISQYFDLHGPSIVIDTACSSALVAMNMAIQAIKTGEIESALVGGINLLNDETPFKIFSQRKLLSPDPAFHVLDQRAKGIILGEGCGMVWLKDLSQAVADGDQIYAVIKGIAINNDGRTAGPATPNLQAQKEVMQRAIKVSNIKPEDVSYLEVNGSGSEVTDLLELKAIQSVYRSGSEAPLILGSVKPNIGHPLCAEGIAAFIKTVLMLHHKQWTPFLSGEQPMTHFNIESSPFGFKRTSEKWSKPSFVAAINSFADGGTNAHVILEMWNNVTGYNPERKPKPIPSLNRYDLGTIQSEKKSVQQNTWKAPENNLVSEYVNGKGHTDNFWKMNTNSN